MNSGGIVANISMTPFAQATLMPNPRRKMMVKFVYDFAVTGSLLIMSISVDDLINACELNILFIFIYQQTDVGLPSL